MIGCLCLHGFTGCPEELFPLVKVLRFSTSWLMEVPVLPGHSEKENINNVTCTEWMSAAEQAMEKLMEHCSAVYVIGFSMGSVLAAHLASSYKDHVAKAVFLSPAFHILNPIQYFKNLRKVAGSASPKEVFYAYHKPGPHPFPWKALLELQKLTQCVSPALADIDVPALIIQGGCDGVLNKHCAEELYSAIGSKEKSLRYLPKSNHMICYDVEHEILIDKVLNFLRNEE